MNLFYSRLMIEGFERIVFIRFLAEKDTKSKGAKGKPLRPN